MDLSHLHDPETCRHCESDQTHVFDSRRRIGFRWRRHVCEACGYRWTSFQTLIDPHRLKPLSMRATT